MVFGRGAIIKFKASGLAETLSDYALHVMSYRSWSLLTYETPPYTYVGLLVANAGERQTAVNEIKLDCAVLFGLEAVAHRLPVVQDLLADTLEIFCTALRVLYATYRREKYAVGCVAGRRHLSTMLNVLPDMKLIEDMHQHVRDLGRENRSLTSTLTERTRACIDSGVLEFRGIKHHRVRLCDYIAKFKRMSRRSAQPGSVPLSAKMHARRHKLPQKWSDILGRRTWASTTPEKFRTAMAAWHWAKTWWRTPVAERHPFKSATLSSLMLPYRVLAKFECDPVVCLGRAKWGGIACKLLPVDDHSADDEDRWKLYRLAPKIDWIHITDVSEWVVVPHEPATPLQLNVHAPGRHTNRILLREIAPRMPLLKAAFAEKVALGYDELHYLAQTLSLQVGGRDSRSSIIEAICRHICTGCSEEDTAAYIRNCLDLDGKSSSKAPPLDPLSEQCLDDLDPDDKAEFTDWAKECKKQSRKRHLDDLKEKQTPKKKKERAAKTPSKHAKPRNVCARLFTARKRRRISGAAPAEVEVHNRVGRPQNPETFDWGSKFHFIKVHRICGTGYMVVCKSHACQIPKNSVLYKPRPCTRELALPTSDSNLDTIKRVLKAWCLRCSEFQTRNDHMDAPRKIPEPLPSSDYLDRQLAQMHLA